MLKVKNIAYIFIGDLMFNVIKKYIEKLRKEDIINFINRNNYKVKDYEIEVIYFYIKNYYLELINNDIKIWNSLKDNLNTSTFIEIKNLFNKYKKYL